MKKLVHNRMKRFSQRNKVNRGNRASQGLAHGYRPLHCSTQVTQPYKYAHCDHTTECVPPGKSNWPVKDQNRIVLSTPDFLGRYSLNLPMGCG